MGGIVKKVFGISKPDTSAQDAAIAEQKATLAKQEEKIAGEEEARAKRTLRSRQGKRSLLYSGGDEKGVLATTLGGS